LKKTRQIIENMRNWEKLNKKKRPYVKQGKPQEEE
jgi:hypothetical protein